MRDPRNWARAGPGRRGRGDRLGRRASGSSCCAPSAAATSAAPPRARRSTCSSARCATPRARRCTSSTTSRPIADPERARARTTPELWTCTRWPTRTSCRSCARGDAQAFEVLYDRHGTAAFSLAYRMVGTRAAGRGRRAGGVPLASGARARRYDRARGSVRTWVLGIVHHRAIDALRRATVHDRRRASDEGIERALRGAASAPTSRPRAARRRATVRAAHRHAARRAAPGHRARLLRRVHPHRDRRDARARRSGP